MISHFSSRTPASHYEWSGAYTHRTVQWYSTEFSSSLPIATQRTEDRGQDIVDIDRSTRSVDGAGWSPVRSLRGLVENLRFELCDDAKIASYLQRGAMITSIMTTILVTARHPSERHEPKWCEEPSRMGAGDWQIHRYAICTHLSDASCEPT